MDSFNTKKKLDVAGKSYAINSLKPLEGKISKFPFSIKVLVENLLRTENGTSVKKEDIEAILNWGPEVAGKKDIAFTPARVLLQDFTGVPAVVDLAVMRDAMADMGGDPDKINPLCPVDLVIDHSVQVDCYGTDDACDKNVEIEFERNTERYSFLRWGQSTFKNFRVVPPGTGIIHQVNMEYLADVVFTKDNTAYFDTLVGTDSHTTMINGLGVLGWGVGGIEAEACMLGQPISMRIPEVVGVRLTGKLNPGITATDAVLTIVKMLRQVGVVGKFVEYFGEGVKNLSLADRALISNMGPEYGATAGFFPIDERTIDFLKLTGRSPEQVALVEAYAKEQGMFYNPADGEPTYTKVVELDLGTVVPSISGPKKPMELIALNKAGKQFASDMENVFKKTPVETTDEKLGDGAVVIAAITSCTNTSNPGVMLAAGILAKKAAAKGLTSKPWVKTSLAPGSQVVMEYFEKTGLYEPLKKLGFHLAGFGCSTCIGNSGPLPESVSSQIVENDLVATSVLSGNRNFEGRINPHVKANYLMSPPLVVAHAISGRIDMDMQTQPLGTDTDGNPVFLKDIWPTKEEINEALSAVDAKMFEKIYANVFEGSCQWQNISVAKGKTFNWQDSSSYIRKPPFFDGITATAAKPQDISNARVLAFVGDSVTTDHISPAGSIAADSPAAKYLESMGVKPSEFNSYGSRRGNHEVMMRGTFANIRLKNKIAPGTEGGWTTYFGNNEVMSIFDASEKYKAQNTPLIVIAGREYGTGSSRDWAAKGPALLGIKAVIAQSYERIHRSNLIGMGILPLEFEDNELPAFITGTETFEISGISEGLSVGKIVNVTATAANGTKNVFPATVRLDTAEEINYYENGGILSYVLRQLAE